MPPVIAPPSLELEAEEVLAGVRNAVARVFASVPDAGRRPASVSRAFGLHQTLAWKLVQIVENPDPFSTVQHIPGDGGVEIFLTAAAKRGVPAPMLAALRSAVQKYRSLTDSHAGDRASLELMLAGLARRPVSPVELQIRKAGFRCTSYTWGVQCRSRIKALFLAPGNKPGGFDIASVRGYIGLRRLRPGTSWALSRRIYFDEAGEVAGGRLEPIDAAADNSDVAGAPLLRQFCSAPMPAIEKRRVAANQVEYRLVAGPVGDRAAIDCIFGDVMRDTGVRYATPEDNTFDNCQQNRTPSESVLIDTFVHRDLWGPMRPAARVVSELSDEPWFSAAGQSSETLPCPEQVERMGAGIDASPCAELAAYPDLVDQVFTCLRWRHTEFDLYRLRIEYPVLRTVALMRFERPAPHQ